MRYLDRRWTRRNFYRGKCIERRVEIYRSYRESFRLVTGITKGTEEENGPISAYRGFFPISREFYRNSIIPREAGEYGRRI